MTATLNRVDALFAHNARTLANDTHLVLADGSEQTYGQTYARAQGVAAALGGACVRKGDRVMMLLGNCGEIVETYIACGIAGAVCVPMNSLSTSQELLKMAGDCTPAVAIVHASLLDRITPEIEASLSLKIVVGGAQSGWANYEELAGSGAKMQPMSDVSDDPCVLIYSSGTTGKPKGILLSHWGAIENARMTLSVLRYQHSDIFITILPLFSSFGFSFDFLQAGLAGATTVILPKFDPRMAARLTEKYRVTCMAGVPTMYARIFDRSVVQGIDMTSMRLIDVGGGPVSDRLKQELKEDFGIEVVESYGLSEISPVASVQIPRGPRTQTSCGPPLPGVEVRVIDAGGRDVASGEVGELLFKCDTFMLGYWNQPTLTAETLRGGWLHSGDVGFVDELGEIHIRDRIKDMIVSNGNNVYPKEVEIAIAELPGVQSVAVIGVPDEIRGEDIHAFIVARPDRILTEAQVIEHCTRIIARFKVPRAVSFVEELPLTASGKIKRFVLRQLAKEALLQ